MNQEGPSNVNLILSSNYDLSHQQRLYLQRIAWCLIYLCDTGINERCLSIVKVTCDVTTEQNKLFDANLLFHGRCCSACTMKALFTQ